MDTRIFHHFEMGEMGGIFRSEVLVPPAKREVKDCVKKGKKIILFMNIPFTMVSPGVVDAGDKQKVANISANLRKKSKRPQKDTLGP